MINMNIIEMTIAALAIIMGIGGLALLSWLGLVWLVLTLKGIFGND